MCRGDMRHQPNKVAELRKRIQHKGKDLELIIRNGLQGQGEGRSLLQLPWVFCIHRMD